MMCADGIDVGRRSRRRWSVAEKLEIVQLTLEPGASAAEVARSHGVNANQLFKWRREFARGQLGEVDSISTALFLVADLSRPFVGLMQIPKEQLKHTLAPLN